VLLSLAGWAFPYLHRHGVIRAVNSTGSSVSDSPITARFEAWSWVPAWAVGYFSDYHFAAMSSDSRAKTYYRRSIKRGPVTVAGVRVWMITYASALHETSRWR
jgi:hypothetical protein